MDAVAAVDGAGRHVHSKGTGLAFHGGGVHLAAVDKNAQGVNGIVQVEIQRTLALVALKPGEAVVVAVGGRGAAPLGEVDGVLVGACRKFAALISAGHGVHGSGGHGGAGRGGAADIDGVDAALELLLPLLRVGVVVLIVLSAVVGAVHIGGHIALQVVQRGLSIVLGDLGLALLRPGHHQVGEGKGVVHMGVLIISALVGGHQLDALGGELGQRGVHGVGGGGEGLIHKAHHRAQATQNHVVGIEVVGVHLVVQHGGVFLVGQQHHN